MFTIHFSSFTDTRETMAEAAELVNEMIKISIAHKDSTKCYKSIRVTGSDDSVYNLVMNKNKTVDIVEVMSGRPVKTSTKSVCFDAFRKINMNDKVARRALIDSLVQTHGFKKTVVQSYATTYKNDDM